jgi:hypothetical protein
MGMMDKAKQMANKAAGSEKTQEYIDKARDKAGDTVNQQADRAKDEAKRAGELPDQDRPANNSGS